jgi:hypothetical protein
MNTTHDDNATTWHDLAGELTAKEPASLERLERETQGRAPAELLLDLARRGIAGRLADTAYCDVPAPADGQNLKRGGWSRALVWCEFRDWELCVDIDGRQHCDGTVERDISVYGDDLTLTSAGARRLAALLVEAADELDRLP